MSDFKLIQAATGTSGGRHKRAAVMKGNEGGEGRFVYFHVVVEGGLQSVCQRDKQRSGWVGPSGSKVRNS